MYANAEISDFGSEDRGTPVHGFFGGRLEISKGVASARGEWSAEGHDEDFDAYAKGAWEA